MRGSDGTTRTASPARIVNGAVGVALGVSIILITAAERLPSLPLALEVDGPRVVTTAVEGGKPAKHDVTRVRVGASDAPFALAPVDLIEEPDVAHSWAELDDFYRRQGELWRRLQGSSLDVEIDGAWRTLPIERRGLGGLPWTFHALLLAAFVAWVVGFVTYAFSDRGIAARIYAASAVAFSFAVWPTALYAARPLALEPSTFRALSTIDHAGALLFAAGVVGLLAVYPVRLFRTVSWLWASAVLAAVACHYQIADMSLVGFYTFNAAQFALFLGVAALQWRAARKHPLERAALGWILLSMLTGVIFFFTLITLPVLLGAPPTITQTTGLVSIVFMFVGISLGVLRFRLFDLDRWWFRTWSWILGGLVVVGVDLILTRLFEIRQNVALIASLVVVGWIYFPLRQRLFERVGRMGQAARAYDARRLITATSAQELRVAFRDALQSSFAPLEIEVTDDLLDEPRLSGEGAWLEVPSPTRDGSFRCHFRENGARLFSRDDVARAADLATLSASVHAALEARAQGEIAERNRIRRDLHDDLGASIIRIAHEANDERTAALAKSAMRDLRDVLTALQEAPVAYADALEDLEADLRARARADGREFEWIARGVTDRVLDARTGANLLRTLREAMTNALKHGTGKIRFEFEGRDAELCATVVNGASEEEPIEVGMGLDNIRSRMGELGGSASFVREGGLFRLTLRLPWSGGS